MLKYLSTIHQTISPYVFTLKKSNSSNILINTERPLDFIHYFKMWVFTDTKEILDKSKVCKKKSFMCYLTSSNSDGCYQTPVTSPSDRCTNIPNNMINIFVFLLVLRDYLFVLNQNTTFLMVLWTRAQVHIYDHQVSEPLASPSSPKLPTITLAPPCKVRGQGTLDSTVTTAQFTMH